MLIEVQTKGLEMTDAIRQYAQEKAEDLQTYFDHIVSIDIIVGMDSNHHNKGEIYFAEFNVGLPGKAFNIKKESEDLYKAIDKVKDHLKVELEKMKGKMRNRDKEELREVKGYQE
ncbi:MAG TPA: ribosome-associated translation inhibitor RaiA [Candidatus Magasanikbacteria bacterium]|nr:MAG: ribosomal subunit interface protein [Candidatus Magasanikbacteria bacterium RIFOXYC2_FULL_39_8]HAT03238.1 ribosome-associated translation inhibitor RaiA [Candidatus Magasanikbacteria bacterium]